jgi:hypothetical protein
LLKQQLDLSWFGQQHACLPDFTYRWSGGDGVAELELVQDGPSCQRRRGPAARSAPPASTQEASPSPTPCRICSAQLSSGGRGKQEDDWNCGSKQEQARQSYIQYS